MSRRAARPPVTVAAALGLTLVTLACGGPNRDQVRLEDIELPPGLERYEGAYETTLDVTMGLTTESRPGTRLPLASYFVGAEDDTELDRWFREAAGRAGFEAPPGDGPFWGSGPWHTGTRDGDQYLIWGTIPFATGDGDYVHLFALYLTEPE